MLARALAPLTGASGRERWLALAASLAFHLVVIGALIWLFVPSADEREATVTIEVTIVGPDGTEAPANTGTAQTPPAAQGLATPHKPPAPAAQDVQPQSTASLNIPPPPPSSSDVAVPPAIPTLSEPSSAPAAAANAARENGAAQPSTARQSGAAGAASAGNGDNASPGQPGSGEGDRPPRYKLGSGSTPYPPYPVVARRNGYQGRVVVRLEVAADGRTTGAEVLQSSGYDVLDQSAVDTLKDWKLEPALAGGRPVPGSVNVPVRFRLSS